jgi:hypothetical protein
MVVIKVRKTCIIPEKERERERELIKLYAAQLGARIINN